MEVNNIFYNILSKHIFFKEPSILARMGTTFETKNKKYFYDRGTGKVLECTEKEYQVLSYLMGDSGIDFIWKWTEAELKETLDGLESVSKAEHLLLTPEYKNFAYGEDSFLIPKINEEVTQLILELTQQCNLRCGYCIYNDMNKMFRNFEFKDMSWETAKAAIDYIYVHSKEKEKIYITFYGGEPLVKYDLLKECIEYSRERAELEKREVSFSFTTNLTLITKERAEYFASIENLNIMGSLDGPEDIHNEYRKTIGKEGSFDKTIKGLKLLVDAFGDRAKQHLSINAVFTPPYTKEKLEKIKNFFYNLEWFPNETKIRIQYVDFGTLEDEERIEKEIAKGEVKEVENPLIDWCVNNICENEDCQYEFELQKQELLIIHKRYVGNKPLPIMKRNGCCIPGSRRLYVTVEGNFQICERVGDTPAIGNVRDGISYEAIKKYYIEEYEQASIEKCNECWASHLCGICYAGCFSRTGINMKKKSIACNMQRLLIKDSLKAYHQIDEEKPYLLEPLDDIQII